MKLKDLCKILSFHHYDLFNENSDLIGYVDVRCGITVLAVEEKFVNSTCNFGDLDVVLMFPEVFAIVVTTELLQG